jgi:hypothetical protein
MVALLRTSAVILAATGCALTHRVPTDIKLRGESLNSRLFAGRLRQSASGRGSISCDSAKWAQLRTLGTRAGLPAYTEAPQLISAAAARYLLGAPSAVWESKTTFASPIASLADTTRIIAQTHFIGFELDRRTTATPIPLPPGVRVAFAPFAVALPNGSLHVIWASPSSPDSIDTPTVVWDAIYTSGKGVNQIVFFLRVNSSGGRRLGLCLSGHDRPHWCSRTGRGEGIGEHVYPLRKRQGGVRIRSPVIERERARS